MKKQTLIKKNLEEEHQTEDKNKELRKNFIECLYETLDSVVSPTPFFQIIENNNIDVKFLNGKGVLPEPNSFEINVLDIDIASLFFEDFLILYEGVTGTGKTYTSEALFNAIFGPDGYCTLRLSGGVLGNSALEPFTTTVLENGIPKIKIDHEKCSKYGALFIDEINRGDCQEVFQVVDRVININGEKGYLRIPIKGTDRYKSIEIIAAMNPADAQHSSALELDIAGENRFLKFKFPNGVVEAASNQLEKKLAEDIHGTFWSNFKKRTGMEGGWREIYPAITEPKQFSEEITGEIREFIDIALGYVGENPMETFNRNKELMKQGGLEPLFSVREDNDYKKILETQGKLKHGFVRRDVRKIKDLSRLIGFVKGIKNGSYEFLVSLNDVAAGIGIVLESKTITGTDYGALMNLVRDTMLAYNKLKAESKVPSGYGIKQAIWQAAVYHGQKNEFNGYINTLEDNITTLNTQTTGIAEVAIKSRILADLTVLKNFSNTFKENIADILKSDESFAEFENLYNKNRKKCSVYEHRLSSIFGV